MADKWAGHPFCGGGYLDTHFEAARPEYQAMLLATGIGSGWRVLDAGCGTGSFLPLLADLVGASGRLTALDISQENIAAVEQRLAQRPLTCSVEGRVGSITTLPFDDASFDAVWCANTLQYLTDDEALRALREFARVLRPGGLLASKEIDLRALAFYPTEPLLMTRWLAAVRDQLAPGVLRGREMRRCVERAGFHDARQETRLIERWAPLATAEHEFWGTWLAFFAAKTDGLDMAQADRDFWDAQRDAGCPTQLVNRSDFYACEAQVLTVARAHIAG